jgi:hypothetical protein
VFEDIRFIITICSKFLGHGTAMSRKNSGKKKCDVHRPPPYRKSIPSDNVKQQRAAARPRGRQSGLATDIGMTIARQIPEQREINIANEPERKDGSEGTGRSPQRRIPRPTASKGTKKP